MNRAMAALYAHRSETGQEIRYSHGGWEGRMPNQRDTPLDAEGVMEIAWKHLVTAEAELRSALRAALDDDAPADMIRKTAEALANVSYLIPWTVSRMDEEKTGSP